jgi:hypothetical protein
VRRLAAALALTAAVACAGSRGTVRVPPGDGPLIGVYRATIAEPEREARRVKVLLWAERPDRLHAELLSPVGGVRLVLDAGGGLACVVDPETPAAYAGESGPEAVEKIAGVRVSIADLVEALLAGAAPSGLRVSREGAAEPALPARFSIADGERSLDITLLRLERGAPGAGALGTGAPPPGMTVRPLEELPAP